MWRTIASMDDCTDARVENFANNTYVWSCVEDKRAIELLGLLLCWNFNKSCFGLIKNLSQSKALSRFHQIPNKFIAFELHTKKVWISSLNKKANKNSL